MLHVLNHKADKVSSQTEGWEYLLASISPRPDVILASQRAKTICRAEVHEKWRYGRRGSLWISSSSVRFVGSESAQYWCGCTELVTDSWVRLIGDLWICRNFCTGNVEIAHVFLCKGPSSLCFYVFLNIPGHTNAYCNIISGILETQQFPQAT